MRVRADEDRSNFALRYIKARVNGKERTARSVLMNLFKSAGIYRHHKTWFERTGAQFKVHSRMRKTKMSLLSTEQIESGITHSSAKNSPWLKAKGESSLTTFLKVATILLAIARAGIPFVFRALFPELAASAVTPSNGTSVASIGVDSTVFGQSPAVILARTASALGTFGMCRKSVGAGCLSLQL